MSLIEAACRRPLIAGIGVELLREYTVLEIIQALSDDCRLPGKLHGYLFACHFEQCIGGNVAQKFGNLARHDHRSVPEGNDGAAVFRDGLVIGRVERPQLRVRLQEQAAAQAVAAQRVTASLKARRPPN
jgi:hypothetical protein